MHRAFATRGLVRVARRQGKPRAAVLEQYPVFVRCKTRAVSPENRINQRHGHPVAVNHGDIHRVLMHSLGPGMDPRHGAFGVDQPGQSGRRLRRQHVVQPGGMVGIGDKAVAGVIGQFGRLSLQMRAGRTEGVKGGNVEMRQNIEQ